MSIHITINRCFGNVPYSLQKDRPPHATRRMLFYVNLLRKKDVNNNILFLPMKGCRPLTDISPLKRYFFPRHTGPGGFILVVGYEYDGSIP